MLLGNFYTFPVKHCVDSSSSAYLYLNQHLHLYVYAYVLDFKNIMQKIYFKVSLSIFIIYMLLNVFLKFENSF